MSAKSYVPEIRAPQVAPAVLVMLTI